MSEIMCENVTGITYINNMGSIKSETYNNIACRIWNFCTENKLWVSAGHILGKNNIEAEHQSTECYWMLLNGNSIQNYFIKLLVNL